MCHYSLLFLSLFVVDRPIYKDTIFSSTPPGSVGRSVSEWATGIHPICWENLFSDLARFFGLSWCFVQGLYFWFLTGLMPLENGVGWGGRDELSSFIRVGDCFRVSFLVLSSFWYDKWILILDSGMGFQEYIHKEGIRIQQTIIHTNNLTVLVENLSFRPYYYQIWRRRRRPRSQIGRAQENQYLEEYIKHLHRYRHPRRRCTRTRQRGPNCHSSSRPLTYLSPRPKAVAKTHQSVAGHRDFLKVGQHINRSG